jgi:hypothetical protein
MTIEYENCHDDPAWQRCHGAAQREIAEWEAAGCPLPTDEEMAEIHAETQRILEAADRESERRAALSPAEREAEDTERAVMRAVEAELKWQEEFRAEHGFDWSPEWNDRMLEEEHAKEEARFNALSMPERLREIREHHARTARQREIFRLIYRFPRAPAPQPDPRFNVDEADPYGGRKWLVHGMLPERGVAFLSGVSRVGKTFVAQDLALCVLTGEPFAGCEMDHYGGVLYIAAEGSAEIPIRWRAAKAAKNYASDPLPFLWVDVPPCKLLAPSATAQYVEMAKAADAQMRTMGYPLALIVVDTLAVASGWTNENDNAEAQRAMDVLQSVSKATGALVLAIDHHGKAPTAGTRGASSKAANADATLALLADTNNDGVVKNRRLVVEKNKGGREGEIKPFDLNIVQTGVDERGRPITTCVVQWRVNMPITRREKDLPKGAKAALDILMMQMGGRASEVKWRDACDDSRRVSTAPERASRLRSVQRAHKALIDAGLVKCGGGEVWVATPAESQFPPIEES